MGESCQNSQYCVAIEEFNAGNKGINTLADILRIIEIISSNDEKRSGALSCRLMFGTKCRLHPDNPTITDYRISQALKKL